MSQHAYVTRPDISLEFGERPLFGWTQKLSFWHPALPEVRPVNFDQSAGIWYRILGAAQWAYMGCFWTGDQTPHVANLNALGS